MTADYAKRRSHKDAIFDLLSDGREHHMAECLTVGGYRYGARIFELRKQGYDIETIHVGPDETAYRMRLQGQGVLL